MIIDTTNDELLINGQRWQRGGYLLATAYATDQINITARDGRVIGKAIEWDRILDKDKNTFGLDRDGTVTALTNIFNSQVKSPYKIDALRDVENGTAAYGEVMIYRSPGEWQYEVLDQYHGAYDSEAATLRSGATATLELYYTAQADGDGISELSQSNTPASGYQIIRKLYYAERAQQDPDTGTWVQFADLAANTSFNDAKTALLAYLKERTGGTVPISLKMTWEEELLSTLLLDTYGGAAAAYSLRKLRTAYTGSAIRVRRASDNAEQDIGFDNDELDTTTLATFCSGTDGFVKTWYDQSGNGNDAEQTTTGNQPKIVASGSIIEEGGKPALEFDGSDDNFSTPWVLGTTSAFTFFGVASPSATNLVLALYDIRDANDDGIRLFMYDDAQYFFSADASDLRTTPYTAAQQLAYNNYASSQIVTAINGGTPATTSGPASVNVTSTAVIGSNINGSQSFIGSCQELIFYNADKSADRTGIETNINDYYSIYP